MGDIHILELRVDDAGSHQLVGGIVQIYLTQLQEVLLQDIPLTLVVFPTKHITNLYPLQPGICI